MALSGHFFSLSYLQNIFTWRRSSFFFNCEHFLFCAHCKTKTNKNFADLLKKSRGFSKFDENRVRSHTKFGPNRFCRFDVYWMQTTYKQTDRQTSKVYIFRLGRENKLARFFLFIYNCRSWEATWFETISANPRSMSRCGASLNST